MKTSLNPDFARQQHGAALVVGLILLLILTLLAISGMSTSTMELRMAGAEQTSRNAFETTETGLERAMALGSFSTVAPTIVTDASIPGTSDTVSTRIDFNSDNSVTPVPAGGFSLGVSTGFQAYHFDITSTGKSGGAGAAGTSTHIQSFYIVGPGG